MRSRQLPDEPAFCPVGGRLWRLRRAGESILEARQPSGSVIRKKRLTNPGGHPFALLTVTTKSVGSVAGCGAREVRLLVYWSFTGKTPGLNL